MNNLIVLKHRYLRARRDAEFRARLLSEARLSRTFSGWMALVFGAATIGQQCYDVSRGASWMNSSVACCAVGFLLSVISRSRESDRIGMLLSMDEPPNQSPDPTSSSVTAPAGQESRRP